MSEPLQPGDIEKPTVQACEPLEVVKSTYWNSRRCVTVECPAGTFGDPVTVCKDAGIFSSDKSQDEANALADAAALAEALAQLLCVPEPTMGDAMTLTFSLAGNYDLVTFGDEFALNFSLTGGDYSLGSIADSMTMICSLTGSYDLEPLRDTMGLSPRIGAGEYRLETLVDRMMISFTMGTGGYNLAVIPQPEFTEAITLTASIQQGTYTLSTITSSGTDAFGLTSTMATGSYILAVKFADLSDQAGLATTMGTGGVYQFQVQGPFFVGDAAAIACGMGTTGSYHPGPP